jgi:hypothetical protein
MLDKLLLAEPLVGIAVCSQEKASLLLYYFLKARHLSLPNPGTHISARADVK